MILLLPLIMHTCRLKNLMLSSGVCSAGICSCLYLSRRELATRTERFGVPRTTGTLFVRSRGKRSERSACCLYLRALPPTNDSEPTIVDALKDQLGLSPVPIKLPIDEIVIDHIEEPRPISCFSAAAPQSDSY